MEHVLEIGRVLSAGDLLTLPVRTAALGATIRAVTAGDQDAFARLYADYVPAMARQAAELAATHRLRGADAVYLAVARRYGTTLVSRDVEQRARGSAAGPWQTPEEALASSRS